MEPNEKASAMVEAFSLGSNKGRCYAPGLFWGAKPALLRSIRSMRDFLEFSAGKATLPAAARR
jgi:hypothetical protein